MSDDKLSSIQSNLDTVTLAVGQVEKFFKDLKQTHESCESGLREIIDSLSSRFSELKEGSFSKGGFEEFKGYVENKIAQVVGSHLDLKSKMFVLEDKVMRAADGLALHIRNFESQGSQFKDIHAQLDDGLAAAQKRIAEVLFYCEKLIGTKLAEHQDDVRDLIEKVQGTPSSLESAKKEVMEKFENTRLDSANAVLKSNYLDQRVKNLEKVVENLSLMIKQLESR
jgi:hypothetical protein